MRCGFCEFENADGHRFCGSCGAVLAAATAARDGLPATLGGGRYRTVRFLGEGTRKRVYLAVDERLAREVAVAVVKTDGLGVAGRLRIAREAQAMARLGDDPHVVTVYDVGEDEDETPYIVSQYMSGGSLDDRLAASAGRRLPVAEARRLLGQLARALAHAHALGIVHRDLKPANVWLDGDGAARLGDFGLAADIDASRITSEGTVLGTVAYIAPEQALGREPDPRSDLYALGAVAYELLCGRPPFIGDDAVSVISQHLNTPPVSPRFHNDAVPEPLAALVVRLLEKDPARRPASAVEVLDLLSVVESNADAVDPPPVVAPAQASSLADWGRFVGRAAELDALRGAFDAAASGTARVAMVVGEPGIGKTRTVEELAVYASLRGAQVLWGHSYEGEIGVPYLPFVEALRAFVRELSTDGLVFDPAAGLAETATIVPELRDLDPRVPVLPALDGDAERLRLFDGVASFLVAGTRIRPLVVVLDDLHWADKPSLLLLTHLARRVREARLMIVGTYRDVELERSHPLAETIATLRRERLYERVLLRGLPLAEVRAFIEAVGGQETPGEFAELIFRETEGNPFFVAEILRHLVETGAIRHEGGSWVGTPESVAENLPEGVREVIGRRLNGLSADANAALTVAAAMPGGFTIELVGEVADLDEDTMLDVLDEALAAQVIRERRERPGTYEFNHALIRQTLYGELSTPRRVRMHRRVGEALEHRFADSIEAHLSELAYHAYEAAPGGDVAKAVEFARRAGERAMKQAGYEEAARHFEMAVQALDLASEADPGDRADLLLALAGARDRAGDTAGCREASLAAASLARAMDDPLRLGRAAVEFSGSWWFSGTAERDEQQIELFADAERALRTRAESEERDAVLAAVLTRHAGALAFRDEEEHRQLVDEAIAAARRSGDDRVLAWALQVSAARNLADDERTALVAEVLAAAERAGDLDLTQSCRTSLIISGLLAQQRDAVEANLAPYAVDATRSRVPTQIATSLQIQGSVAAIDARYDDAERLILESADVARSLGVRDVLANVGVALSPVYRELGRLGAFEEATRRVVAATPDVLAWSGGLAQLLLEVGKEAEAVALVESIVAARVERLPDNVLRRYTLAMLTEVAAATGSDVLDRLDAWMREDAAGPGHAVILGAQAYHGAFDRYRGLAAGALGRHDDAVEHHEAALAQHEAMRAPGWSARSRYDLALALLGRGATGDQDRAGQLLNVAVETANSLGMHRLLEQALAAKLELQGVPSGAPATASIDVVSANVTVERPELSLHADREGRVTICFSDIVGYSSLNDRLGDHRTHEVLRVHNQILRRELLVHSGVEVKSEGDGFMLAFRRSVDALAFATAFQVAIAEQVWPVDVGPVRVRMGIHAGEVIREADDFFGRTVILGARIAAAADGGEVLVTEEVCRATADRFSFGSSRALTLKGLGGVHPASPLEWRS